MTTDICIFQKVKSQEEQGSNDVHSLVVPQHWKTKVGQNSAVLIQYCKGRGPALGRRPALLMIRGIHDCEIKMLYQVSLGPL